MISVNGGGCYFRLGKGTFEEVAFELRMKRSSNSWKDLGTNLPK